ncbi:MAG: aspartyl protease family protein [Steroidobacteraceae bacterium]|nr:aspartyl protease family protein [Steroidobacteraceae bacterium]
MRRHAALALALIGALAAPIVAASTETSPVVEAEPALATPTTLDRIGRILVPVMINGQGPFRLMVDTGANRTTITTDVARQLGLDYATAPTVVLNGVTGSASVPAVEVARLRAGDLVLDAQQVPVVLPHLISGADGILGVAGLRDKRLIVDFKRDVVKIARSQLTAYGPADGLRIRADRVAGGLLAARVRIGRVRALAVIDTGGQKTLGNRALQEALRADARAQATVYGTTEAVSIGDVAAVPDINIDATVFRNVVVTFGDFHIFDVWSLNEEPALIIGMDVLGAMDTVTIDFRLAEIRLRS